MKIGVTAASGKLGTEIINTLLEYTDPENIIGLSRIPEKAGHLDVEIRRGDYSIIDDFLESLIGVETLILISSNDHPENRIKQHRNVIMAAAHNHVSKIVYSGFFGDTTQTAFTPIILSNRQTEVDLRNSGLEWVIGRNGLYIEPDLEYIEHYVKAGKISNSAGRGKCGYTSRKELAYAYAKMAVEDKHFYQVYNLSGYPVTQYQLTDYINDIYHLNLTYEPVSIEEFLNNRKKDLGNFHGTIVGGIYEGINKGVFQVESDFKKVTGRPHKSMKQMIKEYRRTSRQHSSPIRNVI